MSEPPAEGEADEALAKPPLEASAGEASATPGENPTLPKRNRLEQVRAVNEFLESGAKLGLIVTGIFAGVQYCSSIQSRKVERVLEYSKEYDSGPLLDAQRRLFRSRAEMNDRIRRGGATRASVLAEERNMVRRIETDSGVDGLGSDMALIVAFMDKVATCEKGGLCDVATSKRFFSRSAESIINGYRCHFLSERRSRPDYGNAIAAMAGVKTLDDGGSRRCAGVNHF